MTIREWIRDREIHGKTMFSLDVLRKALGLVTRLECSVLGK